MGNCAGLGMRQKDIHAAKPHTKGTKVLFFAFTVPIDAWKAALCRERRPARVRFRSSTKDKSPPAANPQHFIVGAGVPGAPAAAPKASRHPRRIRSRLIVGKGLALSAQHTGRHRKTRANALHACGFAQGRRASWHSLPEGASPFPTGRRLRIRPKLRKNVGIAARRAGVGAPYGRVQIRRTACVGSVLLRGTPGTAFPTGRVRIRPGCNQVVAVCCGGRRGRRPLHEAFRFSSCPLPRPRRMLAPPFPLCYTDHVKQIQKPGGGLT